MKDIKLNVNGKDYTLNVDENIKLLGLLRDELGLTGAKEGCGEGECGACTVIMDGETVNSCLVMAFQADGSNILTIEGLEQNGELHPIQQAFIDVGAVQCGYCTPGMIMSVKALLDKNTNPTREEIREGISGNLCRCTGYNKIVDAVELSIKYLEEGRR
ncbi:(2Fe-2S)-binding protein [Anaerosalibacter massiliensis]|uniref:(2Fe-2S)-binding protein n=1 Tax=Anaerosalibacter massiliensis TaxID=1347392 RepID=A0A9X2MLK1_9FIRM|nr:(2Fe-2S)-binding protein [Anaerosalibacter massiliensis]MCR2045280.1 (2Fe-2S)-binding protein [Anaerosalibacter massiliensis]